MAEDLPIYSDTGLRSARQFADLDGLRRVASPIVWEEADHHVALMEGAIDVSGAREAIASLSLENLLIAHGRLFSNRPGAGAFRASAAEPFHRGQDCAPPEFIERSMLNLFGWLEAESFLELHPIEQAALSLIRMVDIWPFETGNITAAVMLANHFLELAGLHPFFVRPEHLSEFQATLARGFTMDTQPLVNAIYNTVRREMKARAPR
jgi:fido (protein-threonine AMPylation protein)